MTTTNTEYIQECEDLKKEIERIDKILNKKIDKTKCFWNYNNYFKDKTYDQYSKILDGLSIKLKTTLETGKKFFEMLKRYVYKIDDIWADDNSDNLNLNRIHNINCNIDKEIKQNLEYIKENLK